jgi:hypothetical protein
MEDREDPEDPEPAGGDEEGGITFLGTA